MFWLYVVEDLDGSSPKIHKIRDHATRVVDYRFDDGWREAASPSVGNEHTASGEFANDVPLPHGEAIPSTLLNAADENSEEQIT